MNDFIKVALHTNEDEVKTAGGTLKVLTDIISRQIMFEGIEIHKEEWQRHSEYKRNIKPLEAIENIDLNERIVAALDYTALFFYSKGLHDSKRIRKGLFNR